jgi:nitrogen regulatory protein PII
LITAIIRPDKLDELVQILIASQIPKVASNRRGRRGREEPGLH